MYDFIDPIGLRKIADLIAGKTARKADFNEHVGSKSNPHGVTKSQVGLGNVPNVATNNQTPTYTMVETLAKLVTGEKLGVAFGKIAKAVDVLITHISDTVKHVTADERAAWNGKAAGNHTHSAASQSAAGFMSAADKKKLDGVAASANNYSLPIATASARGGAKIGYTANGKNYPVQLSNEQMFVNVPWTDTNTTYSNMTGASASAAGKAGLVPAPAKGNQAKYLRGDGTWQTPPDTNTTYSVATQSANGLMSAADKKKLDGVAAGANKYAHPTTAGNKHIPSGGSSGQILRWSADGTAVWDDENSAGLGDLSIYSTFKGSASSGASFIDDGKTISISGGGISAGSKTLTISSLSFNDWIKAGFRFLRFEISRSGTGKTTLKDTSNTIVYQTDATGILVIDISKFTSTYALSTSFSWNANNGGAVAIVNPVVCF